MFELVIRFRSQGMQWPLRPGDVIEVRHIGNPTPILSFPADVVIELVMMKVRDIEMLDAMQHGTVPRKPLAALPPADLKAKGKDRRRAARRSRRPSAGAVAASVIQILPFLC